MNHTMRRILTVAAVTVGAFSFAPSASAQSRVVPTAKPKLTVVKPYPKPFVPTYPSYGWRPPVFVPPVYFPKPVILPPVWGGYNPWGNRPYPWWYGW